MVDENKSGLGCPPDAPCGGQSRRAKPACDTKTELEVYRLLSAGSPRLALARAMCVPFQPTVSNVRAVFSATSVTTIPNVGADEQYSQDTEITDCEFIIQNESATANSNVFQPQSDFFYTQQSGISATLQLGKAPFYGVAPKFTPLANLVTGVRRVIQDYGWTLGKTQQITMSFNADVAIPYSPIEVIVSFIGRIPTTDEFMDGNMTKAEAVNKLEEYGFCVPKGYRDFVCR